MRLEYSTFKKVADRYMTEKYGTPDVLRTVDLIRDGQISRELENVCLKYSPSDPKKVKEYMKQLQKFCRDYISSFRKKEV